MNRVLAIETSGRSFSAALAEDGRLTAEIFWHAGLRHSQRLVPAIQRLTSEAGWLLPTIDRIAVSIGPGSFTGVRVGLTCARMLGQILDRPLAALDSLSLIARGIPAIAGVTVIPAIEAQRGEVFTLSGNGEPRLERFVDLVSRIARRSGRVIVAGSAASEHRVALKQGSPRVTCAQEGFNDPRAGVLAVCAPLLPVRRYDRVLPLYVRRSWAEEARQKR